MRDSLAYEKASRDEIPKTKVINHPKSRRVFEKSFVSPTKGTDEVRRDYYGNQEYQGSNQARFQATDPFRSYESPSDTRGQNRADDLNRHVRSFQIDPDQNNYYQAQSPRFYQPFSEVKSNGKYNVNSKDLLNSHKAPMSDGKAQIHTQPSHGFNIYGTCHKKLEKANWNYNPNSNHH